MRTRERIVIYGLLTLLLAANAAHLVEGTGAPAYAAAPAGGDELGPAARLILTGTDGAKDIVLRNRDDRLAWGDDVYDRAHSVAYVFIGRVLNELMKSDDLQEEREFLVGELNETEMQYREQLDNIGVRLQQLDPESDEAKQVYESGSEVYKEYMDWQKQALARRGQLDARHLERCYRELIEAVEVVADRKGIDIVYRFIPPGDEFKAQNPEQAMLAIRLRTALRYPDDLDITDDVLEELSLDVE